MTPQQAAAARLAAIEDLEKQLTGYLREADRLLYEGLLLRLQDTYDKPELIPGLLSEFAQLVHLPLLTYYGQSLLTLPGLQEAYFTALDGSVNYTLLRAPLRGFLERTFGITAEGNPVAGGYLSTYVADTGINRALLHYAYTAQASGMGLDAYRAGLEDLVLGGANGGLISKLHKEAGDNFAQADRALQGLAAEELGLQAFLYQGGLIDSSRPFCKVRNGRVFLRSEIERFGTSKDPYGGYTNKAAGEFSGKNPDYQPFLSLGGYSCRHGLHGIPNLIAMQLRPELKEDEKGRLVIRS
jgi:hypothetical protein